MAGPAATVAGADTLRDWLLHPASPTDTAAAGRRGRSGTGARLARALRRARPAGLGSQAGGARRVPALGGEPWPVRRTCAAAPAGGRRADHRSSDLAADPAAHGWHDLGCLVAGADHSRHDPVVCNRSLGARRVQPRQRRGARFERYTGLFVHVTAAPRSSALLEDIQSRLGARGVSAPGCMRRLMRILGLAQPAPGRPSSTSSFRR